MTVVLVALGAAVGAPLRYLTDRAVQSRHDGMFAWGTFTVNVTACLILGAVAGATQAGAAPAAVQALLGTGLCGALSTYSTFSYESMRLAEQGSKFFAVANIVVSVSAGLGAAYVGDAPAAWVWT
jgi:CrcB protein